MQWFIYLYIRVSLVCPHSRFLIEKIIQIKIKIIILN